MIKLYDLAVKTGEYTTHDGQSKGRWKNVGAVIQDQNGGKFLLIDPTFNFAGVQLEPGRDMVPVSMFEQKQNNERTTQPAPPARNQAHAATHAMQQPAPSSGGFDDEIPF